MKYAKINDDGYVVGICSGENPGQGWIEYPDDAPSLGPQMIRRAVDGRFVVTDVSVAPTPAADLARSMAYPTVGDQLGAIWKAIAPLIEHPEAEAILAKIQAVKDANPKPSN